MAAQLKKDYEMVRERNEDYSPEPLTKFKIKQIVLEQIMLECEAKKKHAQLTDKSPQELQYLVQTEKTKVFD